MRMLPLYMDADGLLRYFPSEWLPGDDSLTAYVLAIGAARGWPVPEDSKERMTRGGVLVVGPNRAFLAYIRNVLPALGELDVTQLSVTDLLATVPVRAADPGPAAKIKGDARMAEVLRSLAPREREVLELRFGLSDGHPRTLDEVAKVYGITRERIRQIEGRALLKLQTQRGGLEAYRSPG